MAKYVAQIYKVRTDNGPGWSHVGFAVLRDGKSTNHTLVYGWDKSGVGVVSCPATKNYERVRVRFLVEPETLLEGIERPERPFNAPGPHVPGTGYSRGTSVEVPLELVGNWEEVPLRHLQNGGHLIW